MQGRTADRDVARALSVRDMEGVDTPECQQEQDDYSEQEGRRCSSCANENRVWLHT